MKKYFLLSLIATCFILGNFSSAQAQTCPAGEVPTYSAATGAPDGGCQAAPSTATPAAATPATTPANDPCNVVPGADGSVTYVGNCGVDNNNGKAVTTVGANGSVTNVGTVAPPPAATPINTSCPNGGTIDRNGSCTLGYTPLEPIPGITPVNGVYDLTSAGGFSNFINAIFRILITAGALLAVLMLTIGGVQYMTASSVGNKTQGLDRAKAAIYGIILIAATWLILNTINPQLLNFNFIACAGGACQGQSSINTYTQTTGFTNPNLPAASAANTPTHTTTSPSACSAAGGFPMQTSTDGTTECVSMPL